ncbi:hypothetical protein BDK51DRAFT_49263 [Blyttiomyces helicus]|uniref:Uncharacterized protein n=1 Tax=Blyttiomyces helicus TaxID=388810 RepID=A0A4P9WDE1_9FUNG|nr:hypothetical protein BDK51DRAFT_49263 [Blyttiomyces helicus]|eukprot:RKO88366.1 hypothetical protein BDK51DRAFT_49263 [Blyttiomyces helicus]
MEYLPKAAAQTTRFDATVANITNIGFFNNCDVCTAGRGQGEESNLARAAWTDTSRVARDRSPNSGVSDVILDFFSMTGTTGSGIVVVIQLLLVSYMWARIGRGSYWNMLLAMSLVAFVGISMQNFEAIMYNKTGDTRWWIMSPLTEPCWIFVEFGIVILNLIKLRVLVPRMHFKIVLALETLLFLAFSVLRLRIGLRRLSDHVDYSVAIWNLHTPAFAVTAAAEAIPSIMLIRFVWKEVRADSGGLRVGTHKHLFKSSFFVLLLVDLSAIMLAIVSAFPSDRSQEVLSLFLNIKGCFALIAKLVPDPPSDPRRRRRSHQTRAPQHRRWLVDAQAPATHILPALPAPRNDYQHPPPMAVGTPQRARRRHRPIVVDVRDPGAGPDFFLWPQPVQEREHREEGRGACTAQSICGPAPGARG